MPMAVPGDPAENEKVLKRMASALIEASLQKKQPKRVRPYTEKRRQYDREWYAKNPHARDVKRAYDRRRYESDVVYRAKKRLRGLREHYARYDWAIKWDLALPGCVEKVLKESSQSA